MEYSRHFRTKKEYGSSVVTIDFIGHEKMILTWLGLKDISNAIKEKYKLKTISQMSSQ